MTCKYRDQPLATEKNHDIGLYQTLNVSLLILYACLLQEHTTDGRHFSVSRLGPSACPPTDPSLESVELSEDCILVSLMLLYC